MRMSVLFLGFSMLVLFGFPSAAYAARPEDLGKFDYWRTYVVYEGKNPVCYMSLTAKPPKESAKKNKRGNVILMITHRPAESSFDVVSYTAGAHYQASTDVLVRVDDKKYHLFTKGSTAWARDAATDQAITLALRKAYKAAFIGKLAAGGRWLMM